MVFLGSWTTDTLAAAAILFAITYYYFTATHGHWKKLKVLYIEPSFPFGNFKKALTGRAMAVFDDFYPVFKKAGFGGMYNIRNPVLLVCNPELIKHFLTKDFGSFHDRGIPYDEESDPFSANLLLLGGQRWKILRAKLTPTFTSGKIKAMFPLVQECCDELRKCIHNEIGKNNGSVEMKDLLTRYTTDVIGTCAFGVKCNALSNPNAEFHIMGRDASGKTTAKVLRLIIINVFPKLVKYVTFKRIFAKTTDFFTKLMDQTVKYRKENHVERNDFVQLMMKAMEEKTDGMSFNQDIMTAQAFLFFTAGLDNVANTVGFCLHHLALDQDLQERVYQQIISVLQENGDQMCYEAIDKMDLVRRVIDEGLRMYTPTGALVREQTEEKYIIPGTDIELSKGTSVIIPTQAIHHDEEYYPNPTTFDPDRFTEEEKSKRHPYTYLPFGEGPRFCIASRFAKLEMRLCLAELVRKYNFSIAPETDLSLKLDKRALGPTPIIGFWLRVEDRQ